MSCYARSIREFEFFQNQYGTIIVRKLLTITPFSALHVAIKVGEVDKERMKVKSYTYELLKNQDLPIRTLVKKKDLPADLITRESAITHVGEENIKKAERRLRKLFREASTG